MDSILERVPLEEAVRTSIISKTWRYRWTTMKELVFDEQFSEKVAKNEAFGCNGFIEKRKFHLHMPNFDCFDEVDQWMMLLSRNGVRELVLTNSNRRYELPSYVFSCLELTKLKLENCFFKPPHEFEGFVNLNDLDLFNVDFGANLCGTEIKLPQLKKLALLTCTNVYYFNINATKRQTLLVYGCPDAMLLHLLQSPCLTVICMSLKKPIENNVEVEKTTLAIMLSNLPKIAVLYLDGVFFKALIAERIPILLPHAISSLNHLRLQNFQVCDLDQLHGALCLL